MRHATSKNPGVLGCFPHFERMLYDNSQLARVYLHAWQVSGSEFFRTITEETLEYVIRNGYQAFQVAALGALSPGSAQVPLPHDRGLVDGWAAAYVCDAPIPGRVFACQAPVVNPEALHGKVKLR